MNAQNRRLVDWLNSPDTTHRYRVVQSRWRRMWVVVHHHTADEFPEFAIMRDACQWAEDQARMDAELLSIGGAA